MAETQPWQWTNVQVDKIRVQRDKLLSDNARLRTVLQEILDGFGPNHLSKFCRDKAAAALSPQ